MKKKVATLTFAAFGVYLYTCQERRDVSDTYKKYPILEEIDFTKKKQQKLTNQTNFPPRMSTVPLETDWFEDSEVKLTHEQINDEQNKDESHYFVGGLEALFACVRKLENTNDKCTFINDGNPSIFSRAGLQLHEHPTQYSDYAVSHLFLRCLEGMKLVKEQDPECCKYSPIHFDVKSIVSDFSIFKTYIGMFKHLMIHKWNCGQGVSEDDKRVIKMISDSISNMEKLNEKIENKIGKSIITRNGRIYWSTQKDLIEKKMKNWREMGIECHMIGDVETKQLSLLKFEKEPIYALKMPNDGEVHPDIFNNIIDYLKLEYPKRFSYKSNTMLTGVNYDKMEKLNQLKLKFKEKEYSVTGMKSLFASLGHHSVLKDSKRAYNTILATGVTSDWKVTISKDELQKRLNGKSIETFLKEGGITPSADMFNLHVKMLDHEIHPTEVVLYSRITKGANMSSKFATKNDLVNIAYKMNHYFIGDWEILSVGSCSRKTDIVNRPCSFNDNFSYGQSGIGISCSATDTKKFFEK
eukprot:gene11669-4905_t